MTLFGRMAEAEYSSQPERGTDPSYYHEAARDFHDVAWARGSA